jgi:ribonuclease HI
VRADPAVQRLLLDLADVDTELTRIDHRRRTLPELAEITEREKTHREKKDQLVAVETTLGDLNRDATRQESDIEAVRAREDRDRKLLKDGNVGARQLADLEHELDTLTRRQSALEDDLLELMERREAVEMDVAHAKAELDAAAQRRGTRRPGGRPGAARPGTRAPHAEVPGRTARPLRQAPCAQGHRRGAAAGPQVRGVPPGAGPHSHHAHQGRRAGRGRPVRRVRRHPDPHAGVGSVTTRVTVEADGGSRGNPGPAGYGAVVRDADTGEVLAERKAGLGLTTNNVAEYSGLVAGLEAARDLGATTVDVRMDSKLVVEQMSGRWRIRHAPLQTLAERARALVAGFDEVTFGWVPRERNKHADRLANEAMDAQAVR